MSAAGMLSIDALGPVRSGVGSLKQRLPHQVHQTVCGAGGPKEQLRLFAAFFEHFLKTFVEGPTADLLGDAFHRKMFGLQKKFLVGAKWQNRINMNAMMQVSQENIAM